VGKFGPRPVDVHVGGRVKARPWPVATGSFVDDLKATAIKLWPVATGSFVDDLKATAKKLWPVATGSLVDDLKATAKKLWPAATGSFLIPLAPLVLSGHGPVFVAVAEVVAGLSGVLAIAIAYAAAQDPPKEMVDNNLSMGASFSARLAGRLSFFIAITIGCTLAFYDLSDDQPAYSVAALCLGNFLLCLALTQFVLFLRVKQLQRRIWSAMSQKQKTVWLKQQHELREVADDLREFIESLDWQLKEKQRRTREREWQERREALKGPWRRFREILGFGTNKFLTSEEVLENEELRARSEQIVEEFEELQQKAWVEITASRAERKVLEGAEDVPIYRWRGRWFVTLYGRIEKTDAQDIIKKLRALEGNPFVLIAPEATITVEAEKAFSDTEINVEQIGLRNQGPRLQAKAI